MQVCQAEGTGQPGSIMQPVQPSPVERVSVIAVLANVYQSIPTVVDVGKACRVSTGPADRNENKMRIRHCRQQTCSVPPLATAPPTPLPLGEPPAAPPDVAPQRLNRAPQSRDDDRIRRALPAPLPTMSIS